MTAARVYLLAMTEQTVTADLDTLSISEPGAPPPQDDAAPFGYMTDPATGETRPKKRPGRRPKAVKPPPGKSPTLEELQALGSLSAAQEDTAPSTPPRSGKPARAPEPIPPFRAGVISKGVNRLYRRAGRIIRLFDPDIGTAVIASAKRRPKDEDDDDDDEDMTVGEAWENLAKTNPRVRAFVMRFIQGGAWGGMFAAHLPIFMALAMKDAIRDRIPLLQLAQVFLTDEPEEEGGQEMPSGLAQMMGGLNPDDLGQMMAMSQMMMGQVANGVPRMQGMPRMPVADMGGMEHPTGQE